MNSGIIVSTPVKVSKAVVPRNIKLHCISIPAIKPLVCAKIATKVLVATCETLVYEATWPIQAMKDKTQSNWALVAAN